MKKKYIAAIVSIPLVAIVAIALSKPEPRIQIGNYNYSPYAHQLVKNFVLKAADHSMSEDDFIKAGQMFDRNKDYNISLPEAIEGCWQLYSAGPAIAASRGR